MTSWEIRKADPSISAELRGDAITRRGLLTLLMGGVAGTLSSRVMAAQDQPATQEMTGPMDETKHRPVRLPAKGVRPSMTNDQRDAVERRLGCQCGCGLDIFICRTTHFTCAVSPAMHRDVMALVDGGHSAQEIVDAFTNVYGERVLLMPRKSGFNWAGYLMPFVALAGGASMVFAVLRRWRRATPVTGPSSAFEGNASPDEMARIHAAMRDDAG
ncbi:MAG: cytochrome c-type biogenesis protein CcmH [Anaerolineae bacterium]|nr:cytochrome c-type biogenesis protein CcmH [Gemmatimonadaceae bacterium]